jgi:hypothetical protein
VAEPWKLPTNREPTEHEEQRDFIRWFRRLFPDVIIYAIPNGGPRSKKSGNDLKLEGVLKGVFDLYVLDWDLFIEMKRQETYRVSKEQKDFKRKLENLGRSHFIARGSLDCQRQVLEFLRERSGEPHA